MHEEPSPEHGGIIVHGEHLGRPVWEVLPNSTFFPRELVDTPEGKQSLFICGNIGLLHEPTPCLAVVGTRDPIPSVRGLTQGLVAAVHEEALRRGVSIRTVSGLAPCVDLALHIKSLELGIPTIAVLGTAFTNINTEDRRVTAEHILTAGGCMVSRQPLNSRKKAFLERNGIITRLATVVVGMAGTDGSGTDMALREALKQNRPAFVVNNLQIKETHQALVAATVVGGVLEGATPITSSQEIFADLFS